MNLVWNAYDLNDEIHVLYYLAICFDYDNSV